MKKTNIYALTILCLLLSGCQTPESELPATPSDIPEESLVQTMDGEDTAFENPIMQNTESPDNDAEEDAHKHILSEGNNIVEHEEVGYCGNTITTIRHYSASESAKDDWEISFWGSDSVTLTDLLCYLDYSEDICRCMPEYTVDTEFGDDYHINLTEGYVRYGDGQVSLTGEQITLIQNIINANS